MEIDLHVLGAYETLAHRPVTESALLAELQSRGLSEADSRLALERAVMEGVLERQGADQFRKRSAAVDAQVKHNETRSSQPTAAAARPSGPSGPSGPAQ